MKKAKRAHQKRHVYVFFYNCIKLYCLFQFDKRIFSTQNIRIHLVAVFLSISSLTLWVQSRTLLIQRPGSAMDSVLDFYAGDRGSTLTQAPIFYVFFQPTFEMSSVIFAFIQIKVINVRTISPGWLSPNYNIVRNSQARSSKLSYMSNFKINARINESFCVSQYYYFAWLQQSQLENNTAHH